jgi:hypothetical protein
MSRCLPLPLYVIIVVTKNHFTEPYRTFAAQLFVIQIPYLYFERNWADIYGFESKKIIINHDSHSHACKHGRTRARTPNQKEKLNGRKIHITSLYRFVYRGLFTLTIEVILLCNHAHSLYAKYSNTVPFGIDKTTRAKNPKEQLRFATVRYGTVRYGTDSVTVRYSVTYSTVRYGTCHTAAKPISEPPLAFPTVISKKVAGSSLFVH